jgi:hypothetical protein
MVDQRHANTDPTYYGWDFDTELGEWIYTPGLDSTRAGSWQDLYRRTVYFQAGKAADRRVRATRGLPLFP